MSSPQDTDSADLDALQRGDDVALNRLMERWERPLMGFAYRYLQNTSDASDAVAEVFVRLYQTRDRLKVGSTNLRAWLFTCVMNRCLNHRRWQKRHPNVSLDTPAREDEAAPSEHLPSPGGDPADAAEQGEALAHLREAIASLPHDFRTPLLLHHYESMSYREIAEIVGCSERGVETRLYRARQHLRAWLDVARR